ncbi:hypothetical protein GBA52_025658 [Prunus armeniaca]|nr:hypothetical protein GBA52_025658 [Prunus armeniaca]
MLLVGKDLPPLDWKTLRLIARHRGRCSLQFPGLGSTSQVPSSLRRHSTNPQLMAGKLLMCLLSRTLSPALRSTRRTVISIPNGPSELAVKEAAWGLARYAAISQDNGLVPIVEPEILLDGDHGIDRTFEVAKKVWAEAFFSSQAWSLLVQRPRTEPHQNKLLTTPSGSSANESPLPSRESWQAPHNSFLSGGQSEVEATLNLNAMNQAPNPWHVLFSYARALQNTCLKKWGGRPENVKEAQEALLVRAKANSLAQLGKYTGEGESEESKQGMFVKGYVY